MGFISPAAGRRFFSLPLPPPPREQRNSASFFPPPSSKRSRRRWSRARASEGRLGAAIAGATVEKRNRYPCVSDISKESTTGEARCHRVSLNSISLWGGGRGGGGRGCSRERGSRPAVCLLPSSSTTRYPGYVQKGLAEDRGVLLSLVARTRTPGNFRKSIFSEKKETRPEARKFHRAFSGNRPLAPLRPTQCCISRDLTSTFLSPSRSFSLSLAPRHAR